MSETIEEMLQRWEEEPTPQLSLQLAEEYRQQGQLEAGATILAEALRLHPNHVAARVAHGRFLLELGRMEDASQTLEAVVEEDPTHLVANKLLIGLYRESNRLKDARDRLDLYRLLNESDPEIEVLEAQLAPAGTARARPTAVDAAGRVFVLDGSPPPPDLQDLVTQADLSTLPRALASEGPFGDLWQGVDQEEYVRALGAEGIFPVFVPIVTKQLEVELAVPVEEIEQSEVEPVIEPVIEVVIEEEPVVEELADEPAEPEATVETPELDEGRPGQEIGATATLAKLYLDQGHLEDAVQVFEEVLAREPDHRDAQEGLAEAQRRLGESRAEEGYLEGEAEEDTSNGRARKIRVLREYLDRLRAASGRQ